MSAWITPLFKRPSRRIVLVALSFALLLGLSALVLFRFRAALGITSEESCINASLFAIGEVARADDVPGDAFFRQYFDAEFGFGGLKIDIEPAAKEARSAYLKEAWGRFRGVARGLPSPWQAQCRFSWDDSAWLAVIDYKASNSAGLVLKSDEGWVISGIRVRLANGRITDLQFHTEEDSRLRGLR